MYAVGTDQAGDWYFQLRYLNSPPGTKTRAQSQWSLNLHDEDLEYFDRIDSGEVQRLLRDAPIKMTKETKPPASLRTNVYLNQLQLFEEN